MNLLEQYLHVNIDPEEFENYKALDHNKDIPEDELLERFKDRKRDVTITDNENGTYSIKYKHAGVNFERNPILLMARGLVLNKNGDIIARGFDKFFNEYELEDRCETDENDNLVEGKSRFSKKFIKERSTLGDIKDEDTITVTEKRDGSLILVSTYNNDFLCATSSHATTDHPLVSTAYNHFKNKKDLYDYLKDSNKTLAFEYTAPDSQILIRYDKPQFTLLAEIDNETGERSNRETLENISKTYNLNLVEEFTMTYGELKDIMKNSNNIEGFVAENKYGNLIKLKTDYYMKNTKIFTPIFLELERGISKDGINLIFKAYYDGSIDDLLAFENQNEFLKERRIIGSIVDEIINKEEEVKDLYDKCKNWSNKEIGTSNTLSPNQKALLFEYRKDNEKALRKIIKKQVLEIISPKEIIQEAKENTI